MIQDPIIGKDLTTSIRWERIYGGGGGGGRGRGGGKGRFRLENQASLPRTRVDFLFSLPFLFCLSCFSGVTFIALITFPLPPPCLSISHLIGLSYSENGISLRHLNVCQARVMAERVFLVAIFSVFGGTSGSGHARLAVGRDSVRFANRCPQG